MSKPDALRTTSIEAATRAVVETRGHAYAWPSDERIAEAATDAVLGVAMPSIRRDAHSEAIAVVEAMPGDHGGAWPHRRELAERLRRLRDTQAPTIEGDAA